MTETEASYIDYETFQDPQFSAPTFANTLVLSTNNALDTPLDLTTPLSRVLFDLQEIDTHIHTLTTRSALPLLTHTQDQVNAAARILREAESQTASVTQGYERLQREVVRKWEAAEEARVGAQKSLETVRLARAVARALGLGRQLEGQIGEADYHIHIHNQNHNSNLGLGRGEGDFRALERAAFTIVSLRGLFGADGGGGEYGLDRVRVMRTLKNDLLYPAENVVKSRAQQAVGRFSVSTVSNGGSAAAAATNGAGGQQTGYKQVREARTRLVSAVTTLYILSSVPKELASISDYQPELLLSTLQGYLYSTIAASLAVLTRGLSMLPTLGRTLSEVSARCQDVVALESILGSLKPPTHPLLVQHSSYPHSTTTTATSANNTNTNTSNGDGDANNAKHEEQTNHNHNHNLLDPLLQSLDSRSLPTYFWRSLASSLTTRVQEMVQRGGASARALRANRERVRSEIRECVVRGSRVPVSTGGPPGGKMVMTGNWEREAAVMVQSVVGVLGR